MAVSGAPLWAHWSDTLHRSLHTCTYRTEQDPSHYLIKAVWERLYDTENKTPPTYAMVTMTLQLLSRVWWRWDNIWRGCSHIHSLCSIKTIAAHHQGSEYTRKQDEYARVDNFPRITQKPVNFFSSTHSHHTALLLVLAHRHTTGRQKGSFVAC